MTRDIACWILGTQKGAYANASILHYTGLKRHVSVKQQGEGLREVLFPFSWSLVKQDDVRKARGERGTDQENCYIELC